MEEVHVVKQEKRDKLQAFRRRSPKRTLDDEVEPFSPSRTKSLDAFKSMRNRRADLLGEGHFARAAPPSAKELPIA